MDVQRKGEITRTGDHQIMEIISCHEQESSFDVIGWIYAALGNHGWSAEREQEGKTKREINPSILA